MPPLFNFLIMSLHVDLRCIFDVILKNDLFPTALQWLLPDEAKVQQLCVFAWLHQQHSDRGNGMSPTIRKVLRICSPFEPSEHILMGT
jgi:hypothetical protein